MSIKEALFRKDAPMYKSWEGADQGQLEEKRLIELVGHTPIQVLAGFLFGIFWTLILF